jgi:hypothetical protein
MDLMQVGRIRQFVDGRIEGASTRTVHIWATKRPSIVNSASGVHEAEITLPIR